MSAQRASDSVHRLVDWFAAGFANRPRGLSSVVPPWQSQLSVVADCARQVLITLDHPTQPNELIRRYLVIDLLDLLTFHGAVEVSPLGDYLELSGTFEDHFRFAWNELCQTLFAKDPLLHKQVMWWARAVYRARQIAPTVDALQWGMLIWREQPELVIGPSPTAWEMAMPRLMASLFTPAIWEVARLGDALPQTQQLLREAFLLQMPAIRAMQVQWLRIHHHGQRHILHLMEQGCTTTTLPILTAQFTWLQSLLYYALIRGKLARVASPIQATTTRAVERALDQALVTLITLFI